MNVKGYNLLALAAVVCGTTLGVAGIVTGAEMVDVIALVSVPYGLAGTIAGRGA